MKRNALALGLSVALNLASNVSAQSSTPKNVFPEGYDATEACKSVRIEGNGRLSYTLPAQFPNTASDQSIAHTYTLNCPTFTAVNTRGSVLTINGLDYAGIVGLSERQSNDPDSPNFFKLYGGSFLDLSTSGVVTLTTPMGDELRTDVVVAVLQNNGPLQPVAFDGKVTPVSYDPSKPLEIYLKGRGGSEWQAAIWNESQKSMYIDFDTRFPGR